MIPQNEMGVIVLFAQQLKDLGLEIINIQPSCPDITINKDGQEYRIEAEYIASNFLIHEHAFDDCDIILCWENDLTNFRFPIIALSESDLKLDDIRHPTELEREVTFWQCRAINAEKEIKQLKLKLSEQMEEQSITHNGFGDIEVRRNQVKMLLKAGLNQSQIADELGVHCSTITRDIKALKLVDVNL